MLAYRYTHTYTYTCTYTCTYTVQLCDKFVTDANLLKSLAMKKEVQFDFRALHAMIYGYIRSLGWRRGLTVSYLETPNSDPTSRIPHPTSHIPHLHLP